MVRIELDDLAVGVLVDSAARLRAAIGAGASRVTSHEHGTWQHELLLAAKSVDIAMDEVRKALKRTAGRVESEKGSSATPRRDG